GREHAPPAFERSRGADHRSDWTPELMREARHEVGAKRGETPQFFDRAALRLVRADVLYRRREQPSEQRDELNLLGGERARPVAHHAEHSDRPRPRLKRREQPALESELEPLLLFRIHGPPPRLA